MEEKRKILTDILGSYQRKGDEHLYHCPYCNHHKKKLSVNFAIGVFMNRLYILSYSLDSLSKALPKKFWQVHRSHIINLEKITKLKKLGPNKYILELEEGISFPVSRQRLSIIRSYLKS